MGSYKEYLVRRLDRAYYRADVLGETRYLEDVKFCLKELDRWSKGYKEDES